MTATGHQVWAIAERWIAGRNTGREHMGSHDTASFPNTSEQDATVDVDVCFSDREPIGLSAGKRSAPLGGPRGDHGERPSVMTKPR